MKIIILKNIKVQLDFITIVYIYALFMLAGCSNQTTEKKTLAKGDWVFELHLDETNPNVILPFNVEVTDKNQLWIKNASEKIKVTEILVYDDSASIVMPVFGSEFKGKISGNTIQGNWYKYNVSREYKIPFTAIHGSNKRFTTTSESSTNFSGRWKSFFIHGNDTSSAIGIFGQAGNKVAGTFLTETGDYRYLEGIADGNRLKLSTFDGAHAFLFEASLNDKNELNGFFRSGNAWEAKWLATRDEKTKLSDMKNLTYLKSGYENLVFNFPDENGDFVSLEDEAFQNKVVIVQIFGTWCPNCMDETRYLVEIYNKYHVQGLEIIGLDFEPKPTLSYFKSRIGRFRKDLNVPYTLLLAGHSNKQKAAEALPMLNHVLSFPTTIIIDKKGEISEIHTGFSGPGTGDVYTNYTREMEQLITNLLKE